METIIYIVVMTIGSIFGIISLIFYHTQKTPEFDHSTKNSEKTLVLAMEERRRFILKDIYIRANRPINIDSTLSKVLTSGFHLVEERKIPIPIKYEQDCRKNRPISDSQYKDTVENGILLMLEDD